MGEIARSLDGVLSRIDGEIVILLLTDGISNLRLRVSSSLRIPFIAPKNGLNEGGKILPSMRRLMDNEILMGIPDDIPNGFIDCVDDE